MSTKKGVKQVTAFKTTQGTIWETYSEATRDELDDVILELLNGSDMPDSVGKLVAFLVEFRSELIPLIKAAV